MNLNINSFGKGKPLVFFHGWGFDQFIWRNLANAIEDKFTIYLVDLPGFGQSALMDWETFKPLLLEELPERFGVVGWSMGGLFATRLALEENIRVTHLFNVATSPRFLKDGEWPGVEKKILATFFLNLVENPKRTLEEFVALQLQTQAYQHPENAIPSIAGLENGLQVLADWDLRLPLLNLKLPTCYVFGRLDSITPIATLKFMQQVYQNFEYVIFKKAAHIPFITHQAAFVAELIRFMNKAE
jgi:pimeloyl-[acyl-carrier protein] methyl ester esterase